MLIFLCANIDHESQFAFNIHDVLFKTKCSDLLNVHLLSVKTV